ncbi:MAG TPA: hypothetical protein VHF06_04960 [Pseudonocardiaceae bacterium]|nr:hypothetical protein [Pseudonocardiaceae bacterium]
MTASRSHPADGGPRPYRTATGDVLLAGRGCAATAGGRARFGSGVT